MIAKTTAAKVGSRWLLPLGIVSLGVLTSAGCQLTLGHDAAKAPAPVAAPAPERVTAAEKSPMCSVDAVASSPGTLRCFYGQLRVCDSNGSWKAADSNEHPRASFSEACEMGRDSVAEPYVPNATRSKR